MSLKDTHHQIDDDAKLTRTVVMMAGVLEHAHKMANENTWRARIDRWIDWFMKIPFGSYQGWRRYPGEENNVAK